MLNKMQEAILLHPSNYNGFGSTWRARDRKLVESHPFPLTIFVIIPICSYAK